MARGCWGAGDGRRQADELSARTVEPARRHLGCLGRRGGLAGRHHAPSRLCDAPGQPRCPAQTVAFVGRACWRGTRCVRAPRPSARRRAPLARISAPTRPDGRPRLAAGRSRSAYACGPAGAHHVRQRCGWPKSAIVETTVAIWVTDVHDGRMLEGAYDLSTLSEFAARAEHRAARARRHGRIAHEQADSEAARGRPENARFYRREAETHEQAARVNEQTALLYRRQASRLASGVHSVR